MKLLREIIILGVVFFGLALAVFYLKPSEFFDSYATNKELEKSLGDLLLEQVEYKEVNYNTPLTHQDSCFWLIYERFSNEIEASQYHYNIYLVESKEVNAFALPGGNIVFYSGLLEKSENLEEIAGVFAHEMGHIELGHVTKRLMKEIGVSSAILVLSGGDPSIVISILELFISSKYDRSQEAEADAFAVKTLSRNAIHPKHLSTLFKRMKKDLHGIDKEFELIMSHPSMDRRIKNIENLWGQSDTSTFVEQSFPQILKEDI